jgi:hypothetical protein
LITVAENSGTFFGLLAKMVCPKLEQFENHCSKQSYKLLPCYVSMRNIKEGKIDYSGLRGISEYFLADLLIM